MAADPRLARAASRTATPPQPPPPPPPVERMHDSRPSPGPNTAEDDTRPNEDGGFKLKFCTVCASNQNR